MRSCLCLTRPVRISVRVLTILPHRVAVTVFSGRTLSSFAQYAGTQYLQSSFLGARRSYLKPNVHSRPRSKTLGVSTQPPEVGRHRSGKWSPYPLHSRPRPTCGLTLRSDFKFTSIASGMDCVTHTRCDHAIPATSSVFPIRVA